MQPELFVKERSKEKSPSDSSKTYSAEGRSYVLVPAGSNHRKPKFEIAATIRSRHGRGDVFLRENVHATKRTPKDPLAAQMDGEEGQVAERRRGDFEGCGPYRLEQASFEQGGGRQDLFAELHCFNSAFASRLHEKIKPIVGRPVREVGELES